MREGRGGGGKGREERREGDRGMRLEGEVK
jgi:hypothetical protein